MLFPLLFIDTFWFWGALAVPAIALIFFVEKGKWGSSLATVIIAIAAYICLTDSKGSLDYVVHHPITDIFAVLAYVLLGVVWGFAKWWLYVLGARDRYEAVRKAFVEGAAAYRQKLYDRRLQDVRNTARGSFNRNSFRSASNDEVSKAEDEAAALEQTKIDGEAASIPTGFDKVLFKAYWSENGEGKLEDFPPRALTHKGLIIFWMTYWPFSAVWTIIHDPITRLYNFLYARLGDLFDKISKSMFSKYASDQ